MKEKQEKNEKTTILVNQKPHHIEGHETSAEAIRGLISAPADYEVWHIIKSPDPEGQLPVDDEQVTGGITVKSGDRFRVVPSGTFGGEDVIPEGLREEVDMLNAVGMNATVTKGAKGFFHVTVTRHPVAQGYNQSNTQVLLRLPASYPAGKPDMFWTDKALRLANGKMPEKANEENVDGTQWLRFSWHPKSWTPGVDDLTTYMEFVNRRLAQAR